MRVWGIVAVTVCVALTTLGSAGVAAGRSAAKPQLPVVGLATCTAGPHCFYGPITAVYPTYGSPAPSVGGIATFAAAADWQQVVLKRHPDPALIGYAFAKAGGALDSGLPTDTFFSYWLKAGITGIPLIGFHAYATDRADVEAYVRADSALLVQFQFQGAAQFGPYRVSAGTHMAVVDGFTPKGPLVVSWGKTIQLTWQQWSASAVRMWGLSNSSNSPAGPGITRTPATPSSSYQVASCWTQFTGGSWATVKATSATRSFAVSDLTARKPQNFWAVVALSGAPKATITGAQLSLVQPNGTVFFTTTIGPWTPPDNEWQSSFEWTRNSTFFFQLPGATGQGTWSFVWKFPDGQTCESPFSVG
jgi:hypothetical protein